MTGPASSILVTLGVDSSELAPGLDAAKAQVQAAQDQMNASGQAAADAMAASTAAPAEAWDALAAQITASADAAKAAIAEMAGQALAPLELLTAATSGTATSFDELVAQESGLIDAFNAGTISAAQYGEAMDALDAQTATLTEAAAAAATAQEDLIAAQMAQTTAWAEQDAAIAANTGELTANTAARDANSASGGGGFRFRGLYGTISEGLNALMSPEGAAAAAFAAIGVGAAYAQSRIDNLTNAVVATGNASGVAASDIDSWAAHIGASVSTVDDAQTIFQQLAGSGQIAGEALHAAGDAAVRLAQATGEADSAAANQVLRMETSAAAVQKLNDQFHFLSAAQLAEVNSLFESGNAAQGAATAFDALDAHLKASAAQAHQTQGAYQDLKNVVEDVTRRADRPAGGYSLQGQLAHEQEVLKREGPGSLLHYAAPETERRIRELRAEINAPVNDAWKAMQADLPSPVGHASLANDMRLIRDQVAARHLTGNAAIDYQRTQWQSLLPEAKPGTDAYATIWGHIQALHDHAARAVAAGHPTMTSWVPQSITNELMRTQQKQVDEAIAVSKTTESSQAAHQVAMQQMKQQHIQAMVRMGTMGGSTAIEQEQAIADKIYQIKLAELEKEKALAATKPQETARINSEIVRLQDSHTATMMSLADKATAQQIKDAQGQVSPTLSAFAQITAGFVEGTLTRQQAELRVGEAIVAHEIQWGMQKLINHITIDNAKTLVTAEGEAKRVALTMAAEAEATAVHALHAVEWIVTEAAKAAASAFTALAGIPIVGPVLAIGASIAAGAEVLSLVGRVASAEGGWDRVPMDNAPALLHRDEMVLPADLAEGIRSMTGSGAGSGETHLHFHAVDGPSMSAWFQRNPRVLLDALGHAHRTGHAA
ncbi:phage tail length tape measure family protein [Thiomonas sp.]|uniref:phage tail length tape measure family protein n=1 Tax=Thiomonas sp. TaxID=2047785 RepID=UPI00258658BC|nr:phage tail length tape measure family protein [Thiomonas sp.]